MKKYIISSYTPNTEFDDEFLQSMRTYSIRNQAEMMLIETSANYKEDYLTTEHGILTDFLKPYTHSGRVKLNNNLYVSEIKPTLSTIDPISGLDKLAAHVGSLIVPYPRHRFKTVSRMLKDDKAPRAIWCTGSISKPNYKENKGGIIVQEYHVIGALVVELKDDNVFNVRQIKWDGKGFYDLDCYYTPKYFTKGNAVSGLSLGDDHAAFLDYEIVEKTKDLIKKLKPEYIFHHDSLDCVSISHHLIGKNITRAQVNTTLEQEGMITASYLAEMIKASKTSQHILVASNHIEHLDKYLEDGRYLTDYPNHILALELALAKANGQNAVQYLLNKFIKLDRFKVATRKDTFKLHGIEMLCHGDFGSSGAKGTPKDFDLVYNGKCITGHCLTENHSVNVKGRGFVKIRDVKKDDIVLSFDSKTNTNVWTPVKETTYVNNYSGTMVEIGYNGVFKQDVTLNHHFSTRDGSYVNMQKLLTDYSPSDIPLFSMENVTNEVVTPEAENMTRLLVAIAADSSVGDNIRFHLKKQRKIDRLENLLKLNNLNYSKNPTKVGTVKINILKDNQKSIDLFDYIKRDKSLRNEFLVTNLAIKKIILDECCLWDGSSLPHGGRQFCSRKEHEVNIINSIANELGFRTSLIKKKCGGFIVTFNVNRRNPSTLGLYGKDSIKFNVIPRDVNNIEVFCLTTELSNFWVRSDDTGQVSLTGNTHAPEISVCGGFVNGTMTHLSLPYTNDSGGSKWLNTHTIVYKNGKRSHIHFIKE